VGAVSIDGINITEAIANAKAAIDSDKTLSPGTRSVIEVLLLVVTLLSNRIGVNSNNSSKPPSSDPNREKKTRKKSNKPQGGQEGHAGSTLEQVENPDQTNELKLNRKTLPPGKYMPGGHESRQVVEIEISRLIIEYQAEVLIDEKGKRFVADFPKGVTRPIQYGSSLKAHAVYMSQYQLIPYKRIEEYFADQLSIPLSAGSIFNFNKQAAQLTKTLGAEDRIKSELRKSNQMHADETGINIGGKNHWLHCASNVQWTHFHPHKERGKGAMDDADVLPHFGGVLSHDHWKPYYSYTACKHSLCNAHHVRELEFASEKDNQKWAAQMQTLLFAINDKTHEAGGTLSSRQEKYYRKKYRALISKGEAECPGPNPSDRKKGQRGRLKKSKSRNLLDRLRDFECDVLRFMVDADVPFTNNQGENDIRMTKVQQKISGCFRSMEGAEIFCSTRGYISTCRKQGVGATHALTSLFGGTLPSIFN